VLVECGFLSNMGEEKRLGREAHRDALARGMARGILSFLRAVDADDAIRPADW
jgi:N-acetylmuramoyl-L-alanine amidase